MVITTQLDGTRLCVSVAGKLNNISAPLLTDELKGSLNDSIDSLVFDFSELTYISSAGLRVLCWASGAMEGRGEVVISHPNDDVTKIITISGVTELVTMEY